MLVRVVPHGRANTKKEAQAMHAYLAEGVGSEWGRTSENLRGAITIGRFRQNISHSRIVFFHISPIHFPGASLPWAKGGENNQ